MKVKPTDLMHHAGATLARIGVRARPNSWEPVRTAGYTTKGVRMPDLNESPQSQGLLIDDRVVIVSHDMMEYLQLEAERRGITVQEAYREEQHSNAVAERNALTPGELRTLVRISKPNARLLEGDEECPF